MTAGKPLNTGSSKLLGVLLALACTAAVYLPILRGLVPYPLDLELQYPINLATGLDPNIAPAHAGLEDAATQFYPWRELVSRRLVSGDLPFWNPLLLCGAPLLANPQFAVLYPPHWLLAPLPDSLSWSLRFPLRFLLALLFTAGCAREMGCSRSGAWLAGLSFAASGFLIAYQTWPHADSAVWLPAAAWALFNLRRTGSWRTAALLALASASAAVAGHPEVALFAALTITFATVVLSAERTPSEPAPVRFLGLAGMAALLSLGLASAQVLPSTHWLGRLTRSLADVDSRSLSLFDLTAFVSRDLTASPNAFGLDIPRAAAYCGMTALLLAPCGLLARGCRGRGLWLAVGAAALAVVYGVPGVHALALKLPVLSGVPRYRLLVVADLALALLAGAGWTELRREPANGLRSHPRFLALGTGAALSFSLLAAALAPAAERAPAPQSDWLYGWSASAAMWAIASTLILVAVRPSSGARLRRTAWLSLALLTTVDLVSFAAGHLPYVPRHLLSLEPPVVAFLRDRNTEDHRVTAVDFSAPANAFQRHGLRDATGYDYVTRHIGQLVSELVEPGRHPRPHLPRPLSASRIVEPRGKLLDLLGVRYLVASDRNRAASALASQPGRFALLYDDGGVKVFENLRALPRAWAVPASGVRILGDAETLKTLTAPTFDAETEALLSAPHPALASGAVPCGELGQIRVESGDDRYRIDVPREADCARLLVFSETFDPGWKATVDGRPTQVLRADHALIGVPLAAGASHAIDLRYIPSGWRAGLAISIVSLAATLALLLKPHRSAVTPPTAAPHSGRGGAE